MVSQIINNKGGLYGRLSAHLRISPFSLSTTEKYLQIEMNHSYAKEIQRKREIFLKRTKTRKAVFVTLITSFGAIKNPAYLSVINTQVVLEDLF